MADQISICNMALAEIVAEPIESLNERSLGARETGRHYAQAVNVLLEAHPWGFATRRAALAGTVNDRPGEWPSAFALPNEVLRPIKILSARAVAGVSHWWCRDDVPSEPYAIEARILFCRIADPVLAYTSSAVTAADFSAKFVDALALDLASRVVMPIKKSREMKADLLRQAEVARQRAIADDVNRQPPVTAWTDTIAAARDGYAVTWYD